MTGKELAALETHDAQSLIQLLRQLPPDMRLIDLLWEIDNPGVCYRCDGAGEFYSTAADTMIACRRCCGTVA